MLTVHKQIYELMLYIYITEFQISWNRRNENYLLCSVKLDYILGNFNFTIIYPSFELFQMYRFYLYVKDDLTWIFFFFFTWSQTWVHSVEYSWNSSCQTLDIPNNGKRSKTTLLSYLTQIWLNINRRLCISYMWQDIF